MATPPIPSRAPAGSSRRDPSPHGRLGGLLGHRRSSPGRPQAHHPEQEAPPPPVPAAWWGDDARWFPAGTPPRAHNRVVPLPHGERFFPALQAALARAESYVYVACWSLTPHLPLGRGDAAEMDRTRLAALLSEVAGRVPVRVLLWAGAPAVVHPTSREVAAVVRTLEGEGRGDLRVALDARAGPMHAIHQKALVVDGQVAFVGGIDLTTSYADRWDTARHPLRAGVNWHDLMVQLEGETVADVEQNFRQRWAAVTGEDDLPRRAPAVDPAWRTPAQVVRTVPRGVYGFAPEGEFGIRHAYVEALRRARRLIYLENQYLWSAEVVEALVAAMEAPHPGPFRIVLVLPARAHHGRWANDRHVRRLRLADAGRGLVSVYGPCAAGPGSGDAAFAYRPIYVHAKAAIVDDEWLTVGSANLNNRGLRTDGEINAVVRDPDVARSLRIALWAEHLGMPPVEVAVADPIALVDEAWPARAAANAATLRRADRPLVGTLHRYETGGIPGTWLLEEAQFRTFDR